MTQPTPTYEVNFDGLIGPTHHFAGLSYGNIASTQHGGQTSNPKRAALQGLRKMKFLHDLGFKQALLPPVIRPDFQVLRNLGFSGTREEILKQLSREPHEMISAFYSASSMWTANSSTVAPSPDTPDQKVHFTPANLTSKFHRALEAPCTQKILQAIFPSSQHFQVHSPLFAHPAWGDEGAANATRFCETYGKPGLHFMVYGQRAFRDRHSGSISEPAPQSATQPVTRSVTESIRPKLFPARQTLEASRAIARLHGLKEHQVVFAQQNPAAIDAGAFHNDVVSVGNQTLLFYHEEAFLNEEATLKELQEKFSAISHRPLQFLKVPSSEVSLKDAVQSYLFNSQLLSPPSQTSQILLAPIECEENPVVRKYLQKLTQKPSSPISQVHYMDLRESMHNGGGPACLRLRVVLTEAELKQVHPGIFLSDSLYHTLENWIEKHYRDQITASDLCEPKFNEEVRSAFHTLGQILKLESIYSV